MVGEWIFIFLFVEPVVHLHCFAHRRGADEVCFGSWVIFESVQNAEIFVLLISVGKLTLVLLFQEVIIQDLM